MMKDSYQIDLMTWGGTYIADNTNANLKTAQLLNMPQVGCCTHKFNLDIKCMIRRKKSWSNTINDIKNTMIQAK